MELEAGWRGEKLLTELKKARAMKDRLRSAQLTVGAQLSLEDSAVVEIFLSLIHI